jgi:hypothetical protein
MMMDHRKQPTALFAVVILGAVICYLGGLGPACWVTSRVGGEKVVTAAYKPVTWAFEAIGNERLLDVFGSYCCWGARNDYWWNLDAEDPGNAEWSQAEMHGLYPVPF